MSGVKENLFILLLSLTINFKTPPSFPLSHELGDSVQEGGCTAARRITFNFLVPQQLSVAHVRFESVSTRLFL